MHLPAGEKTLPTDLAMTLAALGHLLMNKRLSYENCRPRTVHPWNRGLDFHPVFWSILNKRHG